MSRPFKRRKLLDSSSAEENPYEAHAQMANDQSDSHSDLASADGDESPDTADEIEHLRQKKSKKTAKRKLRATGAVPFGAALQSLLNTDAPSSLPLSLKPSIARKKNDEKLEQKAKRVLHLERKDKEDKSRIRDVIGGWGGEGERALRKVAQRGVVKLFNVIQQAQVSATASAEEKKAMRGSGKPTLAAPDMERKNKHRKKGKNKDNVLGRGQEKDTVDKDQFFDLIKSVKRVNANKIPARFRFFLMPSKPVIPKEDWERRLHEVQITKNDLNRLIMDYLVIEGYKSAAEEFSQEANIMPPVDFESIESRMDIREALQRGDVEEAITRVNELNPEILDTNPTLYFHLQQQKLIEYIRQGRIAEAIEFAQDELGPRGEESPEFLGELERTMALLAFEAVGGAPESILELLSPGQRMKTAGEVNAAILDSLGQGKEVKLVGLIQLLGWGERQLEERAEFPRLTPFLGGAD